MIGPKAETVLPVHSFMTSALRQSVEGCFIAQVIGYLAVTGCSVGLLINFGRYSLEWRRIFPPKDVTQHKVNRQWLWVPDWLKAELSAD